MMFFQKVVLFSVFAGIIGFFIPWWPQGISFLLVVLIVSAAIIFYNDTYEAFVDKDKKRDKHE